MWPGTSIYVDGEVSVLKEDMSVLARDVSETFNDRVDMKVKLRAVDVSSGQWSFFLSYSGISSKLRIPPRRWLAIERSGFFSLHFEVGARRNQRLEGNEVGVALRTIPDGTIPADDVPVPSYSVAATLP